MSPRVSVVIPSHNAEQWIAATLESVFAQTWSNIEVVVVDDGSADGSVKLVESFARPNLILVRQECRGAGAARNAGLSRASGEFVQFLDADDLIDPDKIATQMTRLASAPGCIASARWGRFYDEPQNTRFEEEAVYCDLDPIDWLAMSRAEGLGMMFPALWLIPMPVARAAGPWREERCPIDDTEYFTRVLLAARRVLFCEDARCRYRSGIAGSLSRTKHPATTYRFIDLCESRTRAREDSDRIRRGFALSWQHFAHACFPYDAAIAERALVRARALHPVSVRPGGGLAFKVVSRLIGWRAARRLQVASGRP